MGKFYSTFGSSLDRVANYGQDDGSWIIVYWLKIRLLRVSNRIGKIYFEILRVFQDTVKRVLLRTPWIIKILIDWKKVELKRKFQFLDNVVNSSQGIGCISGDGISDNWESLHGLNPKQVNIFFQIEEQVETMVHYTI
ncbi:hypothetical protein ACTFIW_008712 [Dictyostelium discoideum]